MRDSTIDRTASGPARLPAPHLDEVLDDALVQSFPASDPVSIGVDPSVPGGLVVNDRTSAVIGRAIRTLALAGIVAGAAGITAGALAARQAGRRAETQQIMLYVLPGAMGFAGPDGRHHDTIAPSDFVLHRGVPVTFTIVNYDDGLHTIDAPSLGLDITVAAGGPAGRTGDESETEAITPATTTVTFTPQKQGDFRWQCDVMCDGPGHWAMSDEYDGTGRDGFMAGWIKVL